MKINIFKCDACLSIPCYLCFEEDEDESPLPKYCALDIDMDPEWKLVKINNIKSKSMKTNIKKFIDLVSI